MATKQEEQQTQAGRHQEVGHKSLLQSDALYQVRETEREICGKGFFLISDHFWQSTDFSSCVI